MNNETFEVALARHFQETPTFENYRGFKISGGVRAFTAAAGLWFLVDAIIDNQVAVQDRVFQVWVFVQASNIQGTLYCRSGSLTDSALLTAIQINEKTDTARSARFWVSGKTIGLPLEI
jgi:hypothetical protein